MKVALTIAGSDSGGGAGLQADLKTFAALRIYGTSVVTAVTAQNTRKVEAVTPMTAAVVAGQLSAVLSDFPVAAVKTGMLGNAAIVNAVADLLPRAPLVVDPVLLSTSGAQLLDDEGLAALRSRLVPKSTVVTPNLPEAEALTGRRDPREAARALRDLGAAIVVVKGGHAPGPVCEDLVFDGAFHVIAGPRVETSATHGTGCTLSAAIAAGLASGLAPLEAIVRARRFLEASMIAARPLGHGNGPLHHLHPYYPWEDSR
jgi:hydroxymethylpyrimidine kinase/phosphomethylpyrimidine kinase